MAITREALTPLCRQLFEQAVGELPAGIAARLTCSRGVRNHGSYRTVLLFNTWDRFQSDVLPNQHFCYCLAHDPTHLISGGTDWYLHLWINTVRIYRQRPEVKRILEHELPRQCPAPFRFDAGERHVQLKMNFNLGGGLENFIPTIKPHYLKLIGQLHPVLVPVIDKFSTHGTRAEVKAEVATRGRSVVAPVRTARPDLVREYSRSVPPSWRGEILEKFGYKCARCGCNLRGQDYHMDHKVPFTRGGATTKENLQPLCPPCNLSKGNRLDH